MSRITVSTLRKTPIMGSKRMVVRFRVLSYRTVYKSLSKTSLLVSLEGPLAP